MSFITGFCAALASLPPAGMKYESFNKSAGDGTARCVEESVEGDEDTPERGFEYAMIDKGAERGKFEGTRGLALERDERFPVRVTAQFYGVTDAEVLPLDTVQELSERIGKFYSHGEGTGSLVVPEKVDSKKRPTAHDVDINDQPPKLPTIRNEKDDNPSFIAELVSTNTSVSLEF